MTKGYAGDTPATWELAAPDLSGVPGYQTDWGVVKGARTTVAVKAWSGRTALYLGGGIPVAGETMRAATASSTTTLTQ